MRHPLRHMTITGRLAIGFGFVIGLMLIQSFQSYFNASQVEGMVYHDVADARKKQELAVELREAMMSEELLMRQMAVNRPGFGGGRLV